MLATLDNPDFIASKNQADHKHGTVSSKCEQSVCDLD